jgi:hypothetical protein
MSVRRCEHFRIKSVCKTCSPSTFCCHLQRKTLCKLNNDVEPERPCGGGSICQHHKTRRDCRECKPLLYIARTERHNIRNGLKRKCLNARACEVLGVKDYDEYMTYLKTTPSFEPWMENGDNIKPYRIGGQSLTCSIDHIIPTSRAKTEEELKILMHHRNTRLCRSRENVLKSYY